MKLHDMGIFVTSEGALTCTRGLHPEEPREPGFQWLDPNAEDEGVLTCIAVLRNCPVHTAFHVHSMLISIMCHLPEEGGPTVSDLVRDGYYNYMPEDM